MITIKERAGTAPELPSAVISRSRSYLVLWWLVAIVAGVMLTRLMPPFQSPDEDTHLGRAAMLANGQLLLSQSEHGVRDSGEVDENFAAFAEAAARQKPRTPALDPAARARLAQKADELHWRDKDISVLAAGTGYYTPVLYVPHALALGIAKGLNLSMTQTYELTRAIVIISALSIALYACMIWRPNLLMLMLLLTPMSVAQWFSPTLDGLANALLLLLLALWLRAFRAQEGVSKSAVWCRGEALIYLIVFILCTTRTHLLPTLLIPATLLIRRLSWQRLMALVLLTLCVLGWQAFAASVSGHHNLHRNHSTKEIIFIYLASPLEFFSVLANTLGDNFYLNQYRRGFAGILGWLDVPLGNNKVQTIYSSLLAGLALTLWGGLRWQRRDLLIRLSVAVMVVASILIAFFALAVSWNDYPATAINGIQGRYFIPVALILAFGLGSLDLHRKYGRLELILLFLFAAYSLHETAKLLLKYYYLNPFDAWLK